MLCLRKFCLAGQSLTAAACLDYRLACQTASRVRQELYTTDMFTWSRREWWEPVHPVQMYRYLGRDRKARSTPHLREYRGSFIIVLVTKSNRWVIPLRTACLPTLMPAFKGV